MATPLASRVLPVQQPSYPTHADEFYRELTMRNQAFITPETQAKLRTVKILIAGCGSTGGACTTSLARAGVTRFALADNGAYELNNLNRQHAFLGDLGENKAEFNAKKIREINPHAQVQVHPEGIAPGNVDALVEWADLIMDAVDVTSQSGIDMKLKLHEVARRARKPVLTGLDLGFRQWGRSYDYRSPDTALLGGSYESARAARHPLQALFSIVPVSAIPAHCLPLVIRLLKDASVPASQLGCTSDLLASIIVPSVIRFVETGELVPGWNIDLTSLAASRAQRMRLAWQGVWWRAEVRRLLAGLGHHSAE